MARCWETTVAVPCSCLLPFGVSIVRSTLFIENMAEFSLLIVEGIKTPLFSVRLARAASTMLFLMLVVLW